MVGDFILNCSEGLWARDDYSKQFFSGLELCFCSP